MTLGLVTLAALFLLPPRTNIEVGDSLGWGELAGLLLIGTATVVEFIGSPRFPRTGLRRQSASAVLPVEQAPIVTHAADPAEGMRELTEWWEAVGGASRSWLLLGKGPSFERRGKFDLRPYATIAINHVVREMSVFVTAPSIMMSSGTAPTTSIATAATC